MIRGMRKSLILDAIDGGATTSPEVSAIIGVPIKNVSSCLNALHKLGLVKLVAKGVVRVKRNGRAANVWAPVTIGASNG